MGATDKRVDAYIAKSADFAKPILTHIRRLVHRACPEATETIKWSSPFFVHKGVLCFMAAFKAHCAVGFWKRKLLFPGGKPGDAMGHFGRVTSVADLPADRELIGLIKRAAALNEAGVRAPSRPKAAARKELVVPDYFQAALRKKKKALAAFEKFSYSHKKEYVEWIVEAKREETRQKRIATALEWLAGGKSRNWKYKNC
jgi:uncharacterized protein YdeI (YjbR/CyaY-like superfamily)